MIGHSERRQYFGEDEAGVLAKTKAALEYGLTPIVCVGELLAQREAGSTEAVLAAQFAGGVAPLSPRAVREDCHRLRAGLGHRHG